MRAGFERKLQRLLEGVIMFPITANYERTVNGAFSLASTLLC